MRSFSLVFCFVVFALLSAHSQVNSMRVQRPRSGADTLIYYQVKLRTVPGRTKGDDVLYFVNDSLVSRATYSKYSASLENMKKCTPCYLKTLDIDDHVIREGLQYTDCSIGSWKEYYGDGTIKRTGEFRKNLTDSWNNLSQRGYCSVPDGEWNYFSEKGEFLYSETWKEGKFIKQEPEQPVTEIWDVALKFKGFEVGDKMLEMEQIKDLQVEPKFKNKLRENVNLKIKIEISAIGYKPVTQTFSIDEFKNINIPKMIADAGMPLSVQKTYILSVYNNEKYEAYFRLNIKQ